MGQVPLLTREQEVEISMRIEEAEINARKLFGLFGFATGAYLAVIERLELSAMVGAYRGSGSASYHPSVLLGLLVYGYATGVFSSRQLERATYDSVAFRFIAANDHPDHDTIAAFRRRFLREIEGLFVQVLMLAREAGLFKLGTVALDGTKVHANASRHGALSYEHAHKLEAQLKAEVAELMALAAAADSADVPDGMSVPEELARREERLARIAAAKAKIEARAGERFAREQAEHEAKLRTRAEKAKTGRKPGGRPPQPADGRARSQGSGQPDRRGLAHHAEAGRRLRAGLQRAGRGGDRQSAGGRHRCGAGRQRQGADRADAGGARRASRGIGKARGPAGGQRLFQHRQRDGLRRGRDRAADRPRAGTPPSGVAGPVRRSAAGPGQSDPARGDGASARLARRPAPLCPAQADARTGFGIIKSVMGFRQFSLRGLEKVKGEWNLVTMAWNLKRMFALGYA